MTHRRLHVGMRTVKSAVAVTVALLIVEQYGATAGKMIFALIGALSAMEPTFKGSVRNCLTQICGVVFGAIFGVLVSRLPIEAWASPSTCSSSPTTTAARSVPPSGAWTGT